MVSMTLAIAENKYMLIHHVSYLLGDYHKISQDQQLR